MAMQSGFIKRIRDIMRMDAGINGDAQRIEQLPMKSWSSLTPSSRRT